MIACGAGLTIQHVKAGRAKVDYPRIIGHEITGVIEAVGEGVHNVAVGDPATAYFYLTCGCKWCRINRETLCENFGGYIYCRACDGGYAELMKLPAQNFVKFPETFTEKSCCGNRRYHRCDRNASEGGASRGNQSRRNRRRVRCRWIWVYTC